MGDFHPSLTKIRSDPDMTSYRRARTPGASYFFTVALADRRQSLLTDHVDALRRVFAATQTERPFRCDAMVILPDHLHAVWTLPEGDADFSTRWRLIKSRFTMQVGLTGQRSPSKQAKRERGIWQRRFWEHRIRGAGDFDRHVRYCWANPVKHGYVAHPADWPFSSIHRDIRAGTVAAEWTGTADEGEFGE